MNRVLGFVTVALVSSSVGCGDDGSTGSGASAAGGSGTGGSASGCAVPDNAVVLADFASYGEDSVIREIVVESSEVVFRADAAVYRVARAGGGTPTLDGTCPGEFGSLNCVLWDLDGEGYIVLTGEGAVDETFTPLAYPEWQSPDGLPAKPNMQIVAPGGVRYGKYDELDDQLVPSTTAYVRLDENAAQAELLFSGIGGGGGRKIIYGAGSVFTNASTLGSGELPMPDVIWRVGLAAGGTIGPLTIDKPGPVIVATENFIYFNGDVRGATEDQGLWRAPITGAPAEKLGGVISGFQGASSGNLVVFADGSKLYAIEDAPGATLREYNLPVRSTLDDSCTSQGLAVRDGEIYSSMFDQAANQSLLFKIVAN